MVFYVTYTKGHGKRKKIVIKIYRADYEDSAKINAENDWKENYSDYKMEFTSPPYFDHFGSIVVANINT